MISLIETRLNLITSHQAWAGFRALWNPR